MQQRTCLAIIVDTCSSKDLLQQPFGLNCSSTHVGLIKITSPIYHMVEDGIYSIKHMASTITSINFLKILVCEIGPLHTDLKNSQLFLIDVCFLGLWLTKDNDRGTRIFAY